MGTGALSPGVNGQGREDDHSAATNADIKKLQICTFTLQYAFMA
jgi:hypothetical protein